MRPGRRAVLAAASRAHPVEDGVAGIWALSMVLLLLCATTGVLAWSGALVARQRAQGAADLSALAAAGRLVRGGDACAAAHRVAEAAGAGLQSCVAVGGSAVTVVVQVAQPSGLLRRLDVPPAQARARAGVPP